VSDDFIDLSDTIPDLVQHLRAMHHFLEKTDCPGSIHADFPAYVLTDLAGWALDHWQEEGPPIGRAGVLWQLADLLHYLFWSFDDGKDLSPEVDAVVVALGALRDAAHEAARH
jgi:hypothetical protein